MSIEYPTRDTVAVQQTLIKIRISRDQAAAKIDNDIFSIHLAILFHALVNLRFFLY